VKARSGAAALDAAPAEHPPRSPARRDEPRASADQPVGTFVRVAVPLPVHGTFTYLAPAPLPVGTEVVVPFGKRSINGWVVEGVDAPDVPDPKRIDRVMDRRAFDAQQLAFYQWIADYYLAPLGEVIATATPSGAAARTRHVYSPTPEGVEAIATGGLEGAAAIVLREVVSRPGVTKSTLERRLHGELEDIAAGLRAAMEAGWVASDDVVVEGTRDLEDWIHLVGDVPKLPPNATKSRAVVEALLSGPKPLSELDGPAVARLERAGVVRREERAKRDPFDATVAPVAPPVLNAEQQAVVDAVSGKGTWLLHGVTGAGKTEVYLALAAKAIAAGQQVLVLVPEIALTPQLVARFAARFPGRVATLHSALTGAERLRAWRRIDGGEADVAIGARSAVFAPVPRLGLVVVDEENDDSYKQEDGVRYNARDLAIVRARVASCPVLLGSATPSLESWENARTGRYHLVRITQRATPRPVPVLQIIDMRDELKVDGAVPLLADPVRAALADALAAGGKGILLYNRRGYASFVECPGCGEAYDCPSCGIAMVYHQAARRLDCHYCGFHRPFRPDCPKCGTTLSILGRGTERVEEGVAEAFPDVPIGRMDADTTSERGAHARILDDFREGRTRLLVGTQIVAKGHDFPDVHVAAVLGADHILGMPDFRSAERTFALVTQLIGRAGRGSVPGRVFLQTHHPDHPVFSTIGDMEAFAGHERRVRHMLGYPPWSRLVLVRVEGTDRSQARDAADALANQAREQSRAYKGVDVLGPALAPMARLVGRWRFQVILRGRDLGTFRAFLQANHRSWKTPTGIRRILDVDPRSLA
jgi:primosomal protein N' (replication factor Y)